MGKARQLIGVAVIGLGVGEKHARAWLATGRCGSIWLYDLDREKAETVAADLGAGKIATSLEEVLESPEIHVVSIASYDDDHFGQVVAALEAGKHVFVEKPICRTVEELQAIKAAWSKHGGKIKLSSNLILRAAPVYQWLKANVDAGEFGEIYSFDGDYLYGRLHKITHGWRKGVDNYSVMLGGGVHLVDLMLWLTGERPSSVCAAGNRICTEDSDFRYDDFVTTILWFPSGLAARITANFGCVHRHQHVVRLFGTDATFIHDDMGPRLHVTRDPEVAASPVTAFTLPKTKGDLIPPFVSAILGDEDLDADTQTIFDAISVCAASDRALRSNSAEEIYYV